MDAAAGRENSRHAGPDRSIAQTPCWFLLRAPPLVCGRQSFQTQYRHIAAPDVCDGTSAVARKPTPHSKAHPLVNRLNLPLAELSARLLKLVF